MTQPIAAPAEPTTTEPTTPAPPATPTAPTPPAAPAPATPQPQTQPTPQEPTFRPGVPWRELPLEDQVAYWQSQSKKHEARQLTALGLKPGELEQLRAAAAERDRLAEAGRSDAERTVAEAVSKARAEALAEVGGKLVDAHMRVAIGSRMSADQVSGLLENLDLRRFQLASGDVDVEKVQAFVGNLLPAAAVPAPSAAPTTTTTAPAATAGAPGAPVAEVPPRQVPDMGQGDRQIARPSGLAAGREIAQQRFGANARSGQQQ